MSLVDHLEFTTVASDELETMLDIREMEEIIGSDNLQMLFAQIATVKEIEK